MARKARFCQPGIPVLLHQSESLNAKFFYDQTDLNMMQRFIAEGVKHRGCEIHAYGFMESQLWLVLTPVKPNAVQKLMQSVSRRYAAYFFKRYAELHPDRKSLWGKRYRCIPLEAEQYLIDAMCYVEEKIEDVVSSNAEVKSIAQSSFQQHGNSEGILLVRPHIQYLHLAETPSQRMVQYCKILEAWRSRKHESCISAAIEKQLALGSAGFIHALEVVSGIRLSPGKPGRPRKLD